MSMYKSRMTKTNCFGRLGRRIRYKRAYKAYWTSYVMTAKAIAQMGEGVHTARLTYPDRGNFINKQFFRGARDATKDCKTTHEQKQLAYIHEVWGVSTTR